jgi:hypothetical protein
MTSALRINNPSSHRDQPPFRMHSVQQLATRHLTEQAGDAARSQNETYICVRPFVLRQIGGNVRAEAG